MVQKNIAAVVVALAVTIACDSQRGGQPTISADQRVAKVRVYAAGRITLDGQEVSTDELRSAFADLKSRHGAVWYYREQAQGQPHPNVMQVMEAVVEARLPISLSDREDFSTVVTPDGRSKPRE
jgi:biopolymer transport protein ExbD